MTQSHGTSLWQEPSGSGGTPTITPMKWIADGADILLSDTGAEFAIWVDGGSGNILLSTNLALTPVKHMVKSKGDVILY